MSSQRSALSEVLDKGNRVDQATLEETRLELMDRLPSILPQLKLPVDSRAHKVLRAYLDDESQTNRLQAPGGNRADKLSSLKQRLWDELTDPVICQELLTAIRAKIGDLGYSPERVLFELFQNADDAYGQMDHEVDAASFRVEALGSPDGGFRTVHWGRTINHLGRDVETARDLGHARDLLNMLVMSFSDTLALFEHVSVLDEMAASEDGEEAEPESLQGLHAKAFIQEVGWDTVLTVGSGNRPPLQRRA